jgi:peptide/nickel transport system ATP-binding protein
LALEPEFIIADEAVSGLDVSVQAQVINLMRKLQRDLSLTISSSRTTSAVVRNISDRVAVMYLGRIVEVASAEQLFARPLHPYTQSLLAGATGRSPSRRQKRVPLRGDMPSADAIGVGCRFARPVPLRGGRAAESRIQRSPRSKRAIRRPVCGFADGSLVISPMATMEARKET